MTEGIVMIPLSKLDPARTSIRKAGAADGTEELAASIAAHGLLQNLTVRQAAKPNGDASDRYEVIAGNRRLAALKLLAKRKQLPKGQPVPCQLLDARSAHEISLAENVMRVPMHPADQFEAFAALQSEGLGAEEIAARFGVTPTVVRQRLKLAAVSPRLLDAYCQQDMSLDQLMAFTVTDDHAAQERVWFEGPSYEQDPWSIRRALTRTLVEGGDRRARFVGVAAYEAAGGQVMHDLFRPEDAAYFTDSQLLDRLVREQLAAVADTVAEEGWSWVEVMPEMDYGYLATLRRIPPAVEEPLSSEEQAELDAAIARHDAFVEEHGEDPPAELAEELERLIDAVRALSEPRQRWSPEDMARGGALVTLDYRGAVQVTRGLAQPAQCDPAASEPTTSRADAGHERRQEPKGPGLSEALVEDLTAQRTAALRAVVAGNPELCLTALVHALALPIFYGAAGMTCLDVTAKSADLRPCADGIGQSPAAQSLAMRHAAWSERLPPAADALWPWLVAQDTETRGTLLAYCTAVTIDAVRRRQVHGQDGRLAHADLLAAAAGLDMADWWQATRASYLDRVSKTLIREAVTEAVSRQAAENIAGLKKEAMALRAEERLAGRCWLPPVLRTPAAPAQADTSGKPAV